MRKIYSLVLMATMLLVGANAWATLSTTPNPGVDQVSFTTDGVNFQYGTIYEAFDAVTVNNPATITLLKNVALPRTLFIYDLDLTLGEDSIPAQRKIITLDLQNYTLSSDLMNCIDLMKGKLTIKASNDETHTGPGTIKMTHVTDGYTFTATDCLSEGEGGRGINNYWNGKSTTSDEIGNAIRVTGHSASHDLGADGNTWKYVKKWSELIIGNNVRIEAGSASTIGTNETGFYNSNGISIDAIGPNYMEYATRTTTYADADHVALQTYHRYNTNSPAGIKDYAQGVEVTFEAGSYLYASKYGIKINGLTIYKEGSIPYVHVKAEAEIASHPTNKKSTPIYSSGWGRFDLEGYLHGCTGVYIKGGVVNINSAKIKSDNGTYDDTHRESGTSGINAGGSAIVIDTDPGYVGGQEVTISGNSEIIAGEGGYAVEQTKNDKTLPSGTTNVESITITGGSFTGGTQGCITLEEEDPENPIEVTISGGTYSGNIDDIIEHMDNDQAVQPVVVDDGQGGTTTVYVVSDLPSGTSYTDHTGATFVYDDDTQLVNLTANTAVPANSTATVDVLKINGAYTITVPDGSTLNAKQVILNADAKIIVEAGGKLVVNGVNGIISSVATNIELHAEEGKPSIFLLNPNVESNNTPKATVEFVSKSYRNDAQDKVFQRFGIPTGAALESITSSDTYESQFGVLNNSWETLGFINPTGTHNPLDASQLNKPFGYYQILTNHSDDKPNTIFTMTGSLNGNTSPVLNVGDGWVGFSNGYMAKLGLEAFCEALWDANEAGSTIEPTIYTYQATSALNKTLTWEAVNMYALQYVEIEPMQAFLVVNRGANTTMQMDYDSYVWGYYFPSSGAPRRVNTNNNMTRAYITVTGADSYDKVVVLESDEFTGAYESGKDAEKYMNEAVNIYVKDEMNLNILATNDLNNSYLGFSCVEAGEYTLSFGNLNGKELTLVDLETNAQVLVSESNSYQFTVGENYSNDYRFKIISRQEMPTDIETVDNTEVKKGGIYTITGQYMGEMNAWNTLPAGLYIVNGEKKVK